MKKTVLTFGLASGLAASVLLLVILRFLRSHEMGVSDFLGYSSMVLTALLVFFGIRSYRRRAGDGPMTFGRGLAVGGLIALVSTLVYAAAFEVVYFVVEPDFGEIFTTCMVERTRAAGAGDAEIQAVTQQAATLERLYDNPWTNALLTLATTWPAGLVASGISAAILRRRRRRPGAAGRINSGSPRNRP